MDNTKNDTEAPFTPEYAQDIAKIGLDVKRKLDRFYEDWGTGLDYRGLFNGYSAYAKKHNVMLGSLAFDIEREGFIKIYNTPTGKRIVYSASCPLTVPQIEEQMMDAAKRKA